MAQTEVYAPRSLQLWKTVLNWLAFLVQIFVQIVRGTPSMAQVFSYIGFNQSSFLSAPSPAFKPLPVVEIPLQSTAAAGGGSAAVDIAPTDGVDGGVVGADARAGADSGTGGRLRKFTALLLAILSCMASVWQNYDGLNRGFWAEILGLECNGVIRF